MHLHTSAGGSGGIDVAQGGEKCGWIENRTRACNGYRRAGERGKSVDEMHDLFGFTWSENEWYGLGKAVMGVACRIRTHESLHCFVSVTTAKTSRLLGQ
jgi:hypothetical protein